MTVPELCGGGREGALAVRVRPPHRSSSNANKKNSSSSSSSSRHFSRLIMSCCPNPDAPSHVVKPRVLLSSRPTSIDNLPDDVLYDILTRVPLSFLPSVSAVCRRWDRLLDGDTFTFLRGLRARLRSTLFVFSLVNTLSFSTLRLFVDGSWDVSRDNVVPCRVLADIQGGVSHARVAAVGRKVFIVTRFSCFCFDPWTGLIKSRSEPGFSRKRFAVAEVNGRVYVAGGSPHGSIVEEYDPHADEWRVVAHAPRRRYGCVGVGVEGVFYIVGGLKIGGALDSRAGEARGYASSMDLYDVASRTWLRSRSVPGGGCVVAACGARGHVYVLVSHAVELSFWRFNATRNSHGGRRGDNVGGFGEWRRMRGPPSTTGRVRVVGGGVKYTSVGLEDKVVLIQVHNNNKQQNNNDNDNHNNTNNVIIFDCVTQEWSSAPNLPHLVQRVGCVVVDC
ncbi:hypothetical protein vseg_008533 [Gypsophila vaccaria]